MVISHPRFWNIGESTCVRNIPRSSNLGTIRQMKLFEGKTITVGVCTGKVVTVWRADNNWNAPIKIFKDKLNSYRRSSIELLSQDIMLIGGWNDDVLEIVDYSRIGNHLPPTIYLHSKNTADILRLAKNIVAISPKDGNLKVLDPIARKCYFTFNKYLKRGGFKTLAKFY